VSLNQNVEALQMISLSSKDFKVARTESSQDYISRCVWGVRTAMSEREDRTLGREVGHHPQQPSHTTHPFAILSPVSLSTNGDPHRVRTWLSLA
jgi:hypothetical protein